MRNMKSTLLELSLANLFLASAYCALNDHQYSMSKDNLAAVQNQLLSDNVPFSGKEIHPLTSNDIYQTVPLSTIYSRQTFETIESFTFNPSFPPASGSENSGFAQAQKLLDQVKSNDIYDFQTMNPIADESEDTIAINNNPVATIVSNAPPSLVVDVPSIAISQTQPSRVQINPEASNQQSAPAIHSNPLAPIASNVPAVSAINEIAPINIQKPDVSLSIIKPVASIIINTPVALSVASAINNIPIAPMVNIESIESAIINKPVAPIANSGPITPTINNKPSAPTHVPMPIASLNILDSIHSAIDLASAPSSSGAMSTAIATHVKHTPSVDITLPVASTTNNASSASIATASETQTVQLVPDTEEEKFIKPCYRKNRKVAFSQYWIPKQNEWDETNNGERIFLGGGVHRRIEDKNNKELAWVPHNMYEKCKMEGTCLLENGDLINLDNSTDSFIRAGKRDRVHNIFGLGSGSQNLVPFISIAANDLPLGQKLYIHQLDGVDLGEGAKHNGCVRVDDDSWSFDSCQLDFFVLSYVDYLWLGLEEEVTIKFQDCELKNYINMNHLAIVKARVDEKIIPSILHAQYVPPSLF